MTQETLFRRVATGGLEPRREPYSNHLTRINPTKAAHYKAHISSDRGKRQVDLVFDALAAYPDSTDRELQAIIRGWGYEIEISAIPARRADIPKFFPGWLVETVCKRTCSVMKSEKHVWRLIHRASPGQSQH